jgi:hypothetical protein
MSQTEEDQIEAEAALGRAEHSEKGFHETRPRPR